MSALRELAARLAGFMARRGRSADLDDEVRFHLGMLEADLRRQGLDPESAHREARARFGGVTQVAEAYANQRTLPWLETLVQDGRHALRIMRRAPGFTAAALVTLALGIGANTAMFSVVHAVLLRPLPYGEPDRLVQVGDRDPDGSITNIGYTTLHDLRERTRAFEAISAIRSWSPTLASGGDAERLPAMRVSADFFSMLRVTPALGRDFRPEDDRPDHWRVVILSDALWRRRFAADRSAVGRSIRMNDQDYQIIGVLPPDFEPLISAHFYEAAQLWAPLGYDSSLPYACRTCGHLRAIGRLRRDVTWDQALADLNAVRAQLREEHPTEYPPGEMSLLGLRDLLAGQVRLPLLVLFAAVGFVLLIACANVANLLLARAAGRSREMAIRAALGAGQHRLVRQMLTESTVLSLTGCVLGVSLAFGLVRSIAAAAPVTIPRLDRIGLDGWVLGFALAIAVISGVAFGLVPALPASRFGLRSALSSDDRSGSSPRSRRARQVLVIADLALALVLLTGAGLMLRTVSRLTEVDPGFDAEGVLTLQFSLVGEAYREDSAVLVFQDRALERVRALPGVESAALAGQIPLGGSYDRRGFHIVGSTASNPSEDPSVERYSVTPDYFRVLGIPLRRGRLLTDADGADSMPVMLISESTANRLWPGRDPIGQGVRIGGPESPARTVVGIVGDVRHDRLDAPAAPQMYLSQAQLTDSFLVLTVRSSASSSTRLVPEIRSVLRSLDPAVPVYDVAMLQDLVGRSFAERRFVMGLLGAFAGVALLLAAIGLYGVVSYTVAQRTREIGVRVALGARPVDVLQLVFGSGIRTCTTGLVIGIAAAILLTRFLESLLFGVPAADPVALAGAVGLLAVVMVIAHWIPARRALRLDPATALRQD